MSEKLLWQRVCHVTGQGMGEGFHVEHGTFSADFLNQEDVLKHLRKYDWVDADAVNPAIDFDDFDDEDFLEWCYNEELFYFTEWWEDEFEYQEVNGVVYPIELTDDEIELI